MDKITIERETLEQFRDSVLNQRGPLAENGMTSDQINDVLGLFDDTLGAALAAQPAEPVAMLYDDGTWIAERTTAGRALNNRMLFAGSPKVGVYVAPPAQPADSTPSNKE